MHYSNNKKIYICFKWEFEKKMYLIFMPQLNILSTKIHESDNQTLSWYQNPIVVPFETITVLWLLPQNF